VKECFSLYEKPDFLSGLVKDCLTKKVNSVNLHHDRLETAQFQCKSLVSETPEKSLKML
jgi:hypothetical protein